MFIESLAVLIILIPVCMFVTNIPHCFLGP